MRRSPPLRSFRVAPRARTTLRARRRASNGLIHELRPRRAARIHDISPDVDSLWTTLAWRQPQDDDTVRRGGMTGPSAASTARVSSGKSSRTVGAGSGKRCPVPVGVIDDQHESLDAWVVPELQLRPPDRRVHGAQSADSLDRRPSLRRCRRPHPTPVGRRRDRQRHLRPPAHRLRHAAAKRGEQPELDAIGNRLSLRVHRDPESQPEHCCHRAQVGDVRRSISPRSIRPSIERPIPAAPATACWLSPRASRRSRRSRSSSRWACAAARLP